MKAENVLLAGNTSKDTAEMGSGYMVIAGRSIQEERGEKHNTTKSWIMKELRKGRISGGNLGIYENLSDHGRCVQHSDS